MDHSGAGRGIDRLVEVMRRLRDPAGGCPWDIEQDFKSIAPYTIEEAYEVADAIDREAWDELEGELGDLLLQVVYHARMAEEAGLFDVEAVAHRVADKLIARHPHVFGDDSVESAAAQKERWEGVKAEERARKAEAEGSSVSQLDDVPLGLPALMRAQKLQKRAARIGFDWPDIEGVRRKLEEELAELDRAAPEERPSEIGDLLFTLVNYARHQGIDAETALREANTRFERRFRHLEESAGEALGQLDLDALEALWQRAKARERE